MTEDKTRALVLGGGGLTGIAWETGVLLGLERLGIHLRDADLIVGTSAGPDKALKIPAINAATGQFTVFDTSSGVEIVDAVAASCAVPMVWPPVTIVSPDASTRAAMGRNALDPKARGASARAGLDQAEHVAETVREIWG